ERVTATPLDHALKMRFLDHAGPRILPRLLDERVQVSRTSRRLRLCVRGNAQLRFRSLWGFVGHFPTPWIYGFARRYNSRPGTSKAPRQSPGSIKELACAASPSRSDRRCLRGPVGCTVRRGPHPLAQCPDARPRRPTVPFADRFHVMVPLIQQLASAEERGI